MLPGKGVVATYIEGGMYLLVVLHIYVDGYGMFMCRLSTALNDIYRNQQFKTTCQGRER